MTLEAARIAVPGDTEDPLWTRLRGVELRVRREIEARRAADPDPDDPYRGLYLTPEAVQRILESPPDPWATWDGDGVPDQPLPAGCRLGRLAARFGLDPLDVELLLIAAAPDIDPRFERLYGYLNDDLTLRRPTVALALGLCQLPAAGRGRFRLSGSAPLVHGGLIELTGTDRPVLTRTLRVPDRVVAYLLGDDEPDARLAGYLAAGHPATGHPATGPVPPEPYSGLAYRVAAAARTGPVYLHDLAGDAGAVALEALAVAGCVPLVVDVEALADGQRPLPELCRALAVEARLSGAGTVIGPVDVLDRRHPDEAGLLRVLCAPGTGTPLIIYGAKLWDPRWARTTPVSIAVPPPDGGRSRRQWRAALDRAGAFGSTVDGLSIEAGSTTALASTVDGSVAGAGLTAAVGSYRLDTAQIDRAAAVAARTAALDGRPVRSADLQAAARGQNGAGLDRLARRITPAVGWDDLVLPADARRQLATLALRARHRDRVLGEWRMRPGGGRGRGVLALFAGESGTGKTMSAEVVAADLGMDLYVVDLSSVVDKYVGETEKNLERIFTEAASVNGVLLFDEADAVFGKRSEVSSAHDRYANVESAYLLQRMESFDGIAVLTTNLRANLDDAFTRRLDVVVEFPLPDAARRVALWDRCLGPYLPRADELDLELLAERFELSGGSIRSCAVTAAYLAAEGGRPVGMADLVSAVREEYRKLGRLLLDSEFAVTPPPRRSCPA